MVHRLYWQGGYPGWGYGAMLGRGGCSPSMRLGRWPFFGAHGSGFAPHPPAYPAAPMGPLNDRDISKMVTDYLKSDPRLSPGAEIMVDVSDGVVTLRGTVPNKWNKYLVGDDCFHVPAAVDVVNKLKIVEKPRAERARGKRGGRQRS